MYGWRTRIGIVFPSRGDTFTYEFYKIVPEGVVLVSTSSNLHNLTEAELSEAAKKFDDAAEDLARVGVDVIVLSGSPLFQLKGVGSDIETIQRVQQLTNIVTTTQITSEMEALRQLKINKLVVATPFREEVNTRSRKFLEAHGFTVLGMKGLGIQKNSEIAEVPTHVPYRLAKELFREHPDADGIYIACPRWGTVGMIERLEEDLNVPVVTGVQAVVWNALRKTNTNVPIKGFGTLLENA